MFMGTVRGMNDSISERMSDGMIDKTSNGQIEGNLEGAPNKIIDRVTDSMSDGSLIEISRVFSREHLLEGIWVCLKDW